MPEDLLLKLAGLPDSAAAVGDSEVVEDEQFAGLQADFHGLDGKAPRGEEAELGVEVGELQAAEEARRRDGRQRRSRSRAASTTRARLPSR